MKISKGKWAKYKHMKGSASLAKRLPETKLWSEAAFSSLLHKYRKIILKPCNGSLGCGIIQVSILDKSFYTVHYERKLKRFKSEKKALFYIKTRMKSPHYIVQRYIPLIAIKGNPVDLRVVVQRQKNAAWKVTGSYAKVARKGYIITNETQKVIPIRTAITRYRPRS